MVKAGCCVLDVGPPPAPSRVCRVSGSSRYGRLGSKKFKVSESKFDAAIVAPENLLKSSIDSNGEAKATQLGGMLLKTAFLYYVATTSSQKNKSSISLSRGEWH